MPVAPTSRTPAIKATVDPGYTTIGMTFDATDGAYIYEVKLFWRVGSGTWQEWSSGISVWTGTGLKFETEVSSPPEAEVEWSATCYFVDEYGRFQVANYYPWPFTVKPDTTAPTITPSAPAASQAPGVDGITFAANIQDNWNVVSVKLYVDGDLVKTWSAGSGVRSFVKKLTKGAHSYYWWAKDGSGNESQTASTDFTVVNAAPAKPAGVVTVLGRTGAVSVANLGAIPVSWPAFPDGNPEDAVTYRLENRAAGGGWALVAEDISSPAYEWTPDLGLGAVELRVRATDGTDTSDWMTRTGITVVASQPPNAPTLTAPTDSDDWREGETHDVTWTKADPEHPEGLPCTYEVQFSAAGDFSDAVTVGSGLTGESWPWVLSPELVDADTATCKVRVQAVDGGGRASAWSASDAFTVRENAPPTLTLVSPADGEVIAGNELRVTVEVTDADDDPLHVEVEYALRPDWGDSRTARSAFDQDGFTVAEAPYTDWDALGPSGAASGERVRYTTPALRYDYYWVRARVTDGILYSPWSAPIRVLTSPSGLVPLTCTIADEAYLVMGLKVSERTGGEPSPLEFDITLSDYLERPVERGMGVSVGLALDEHVRAWNATVESVRSQGALVHIYCLQDDAYLARKVVPTDYVADDVGANLAALVDEYGAPLDSGGIDTTLGVEADIVGDGKTVGGHLREWSEALGYLFWVDATGTVHVVKPENMPSPDVALWEPFS